MTAPTRSKKSSQSINRKNKVALDGRCFSSSAHEYVMLRSSPIFCISKPPFLYEICPHTKHIRLTNNLNDMSYTIITTIISVNRKYLGS